MNRRYPLGRYLHSYPLASGARLEGYSSADGNKSVVSPGQRELRSTGRTTNLSSSICRVGPTLGQLFAVAVRANGFVPGGPRRALHPARQKSRGSL